MGFCNVTCREQLTLNAHIICFRPFAQYPGLDHDHYGMKLKGQCHEDFEVLRQFCAKIIASRLNLKQNASVKL